MSYCLCCHVQIAEESRNFFCDVRLDIVARDGTAHPLQKVDRMHRGKNDGENGIGQGPFLKTPLETEGPKLGLLEPRELSIPSGKNKVRGGKLRTMPLFCMGSAVPLLWLSLPPP